MTDPYEPDYASPLRAIVEQLDGLYVVLTEIRDRLPAPPWEVHYPGYLHTTREDDGSVTLAVGNPGPMLVSRVLAEGADRRYIQLDGDVLTFHGMARNPDHPFSVAYRIVGERDGWLLTEPIAPSDQGPR